MKTIKVYRNWPKATSKYDAKPDSAIWLQGLGYVAGKPAGELVVGNVMVWNYGHTETITSKMHETGKTIVFGIEYAEHGTDKKARSNRKLSKAKIVAVMEEVAGDETAR
jgi:hypothetical protein